VTSASLARVAFELLPTGEAVCVFREAEVSRTLWRGVTGECPKRESAGEFPGHEKEGKDVACFPRNGINAKSGAGPW
jgi:hypothetical protein